MKNLSSFISHLSSREGFTLMEALVVLTISMTVGVIVLSILFSSFRLTNKVNTLNTVRQNGNNAISQIAKMLRDAKKLDSPTSCISPISQTFVTFTSLDEGQTRFECSDSPATISSNSASLLDTNTVALIPNSCWFICSQDNISDFPTISIRFSLIQVSPPGVTLPVEKTATVPFGTSVVLRNVRR